MTVEEARRLIVFESCIEEGNTSGLIVSLRSGDDPGRGRVRELLTAIKTIFADNVGKENIDRTIAYALHVLARQVVSQTSGTQSKAWTKSSFNGNVLT